MTRPAVITAADYLLSPTEAGMLRTLTELVGYRHGKIWHVRDARECPELTDLPDVVALVPRPDGGAILAALEPEVAAARCHPGQREVAALLARVDRAVAGVVRPIPRDGELSFDEVLARLQAERPPE